MDEPADELKGVELRDEIFKGIKFYVTGEVHAKVVELLKSGGAERSNYFSDYVTHLIVGSSPEENDIADANDLYEIPAVTPKWIYICAQLKKLVSNKPYLYAPQKLFTGFVFCLEKVEKDLNSLWGLITYNGGLAQVNLDGNCTHLVTISTLTRKFLKAESCPDRFTIVTPDWVVESVRNCSLADANLFHPKLIEWPKVAKIESTTAITGFEPDAPIENEAKEEKDFSDQTQALLEKLKQRMPWNQPVTTSETVAPPNVIAPSFTGKQQQSPVKTPAQQNLPQSPVSSQIPRSIVHHTPQTSVQNTFGQQQQQQQQQQQSQMGIGRILSPQQPQQSVRPPVQQLRAPLPNPIHQQLLQQRLNQQNQQNIIQRTPGRQMVMPQQLLQRQLIQNQGQMLNPQPPQQQQPQQIPNQHQLAQIQQLKQQMQQQQQQNQQLQQQNPPNFSNIVQQQIFNQQNQLMQNQQQQQQSQLIQNQQQQQQQSQILQNQQQNQLIQSQQMQNQQQNQLLQNQQQNQLIQNQQLLQSQQQNQLLLQQNQQNQIIQSQQIVQNQQFVSQNAAFVQSQQSFAQQNLSQQLGQKNLGPQLNQQQLSQQQLVQQHSISQQSLDDLNQSPTNVQQIQQLNQTRQLQQQQQQQQQGIVQTNLNQQVIRTQFPGNIVNQQIMINQQQQQQQGAQGQPRAQINQHFFQQQNHQPIRHPVNIVQQGPRTQWPPNQQGNVPVRQYIQLDASTHNQLQKMPPEQRASFVAKLQRMNQVQQRGGSHILIRGAVPAGLNHQQQVQWLQQQAKQQGIALPPNLQQQNITPGTLTPQQPQPQSVQHAPGLSPIQQNPPQFAAAATQAVQGEQNSQQQLQLRQFRLHQLQLQREQAQKGHLVGQQTQAPGQNVVRPIGQPPTADPTSAVVQPLQDGSVPHPLVVNAKTKTALANMLSIRLQSGGSSIGPVQETVPEPSAACTLRMMNAQHNAALNSNTRSQELLGLQQRGRVISGPNGEIIRAPGAVSTPATPQVEPTKLQYGPRPAVPVQHRPGPFYGHNPNLKLPANLFLLGCIFVVVEIERYLDESLPGWQQKIEKHGGEVERQYCNRVTHVLCETQRHGVVMQALRDCKRCITIYWLSDVMKRRQVLPPWTALHLPTMYLDTTPASKHLISISGFVGAERNKVKHMITYTGAKMTSYFSKHNTLLVAAKTEGPKYAYAKKCGIPVVNVQWLTDVMLGNFTALSQMEHVVYQQFPAPPNFSFDPKLVPNLMHAWKMPINISQESYERVKRSASPVLMPKKAKKQKTEQTTDENDNIDESNAASNTTHRILFSMASDANSMEKMVRELGGVVTKNYQDCTHLVMPQLSRSFKLMFCICQGVYILPEQWLRDSHSANQFLLESNYQFDAKDFNRQFKTDFGQTLAAKNRDKLFEGKYFWVTPSVFPSKKTVEELIRASGGFVERVRRSATQIEATNVNSPYSYVIITHENDIHLVADLLKNKKEKVKVICSAELVFSAILKQTFEVDQYAVKVL